MQRPNCSRIVVAALLLAATPLAVSAEPQGPAGPRNPDVDEPTAPIDHDPACGGSILLAVRVDAHGVTVLKGCAKPTLECLPVKATAQRAFRWTLRGADGDALSSGSFDPGPIDLAPARFGGEPRVISEDRILPTAAYAAVKFPAISGWDSLEFTRRIDGVETPFGIARARDIDLR